MISLIALLLLACEAPAPTATPIVGGDTPTVTATPALTATPSPSPAPPSPTATATVTPEPMLSATPTETTTATPHTTPTQPSVSVTETTISIPTYPFRAYLTEQFDSQYRLPVYYFRRGDYEAELPSPTPTSVDYRAIVLENPYLQLTFLPELGGRLYGAQVKATGQEIFYHNPVVKPSRYGILQPVEANWWLATGGMEWAYPVQEHGYRWGVSWEASVEQHADGAVITLSDRTSEGLQVSVAVTLPADAAAFTVRPRLVNGLDQTVPIQFWLNAALSLSDGSMSPQTEFVVPVDQIVVHSRGAEGWAVPGARETAPWPQVGQTDLRRYEQWANYLGFFVPNMDEPFMGAYNPETDLGVARLIEPGAVPGNKLFAFGPDFPDRSYTDDGSQYFEIWGGINEGFWPADDRPVSPGERLTWQESWWPLAGLGGLTWATDRAAIALDSSPEDQTLSLLLPRPGSGGVTIRAGERTILTETFEGNPTSPLRWAFSAPAEPLQVTVTGPEGELWLVYEDHP